MCLCICRECGEKFEATTSFAKWCGSRCRMRKYRRSEKGKAAVVEQNRRYKRPDIERVCEGCQGGFVTARKSQLFCSGCGKESSYFALKRYRAKNLEKCRKWNRVNRMAQRHKGHSFVQCCSVEGCEVEGERHHPDYSKPLEIVWLCRKHHRAVHCKKVA